MNEQMSGGRVLPGDLEVQALSRLPRWEVRDLRGLWRSPWMGLALVIVVAAMLRYPALDALPPGLNFDEGGEGVAEMDVWNGIYRIWWPIGGGKEPLMAYAVQPFLWVFGFTQVALRAYTATLGVIAAAGTWWLAKELFGGEGCPASGAVRGAQVSAWLISIAAGLGLATAFWHGEIQDNA